MDRTALITGGTGGLGTAVVERFLADGWRVVVPWIAEKEMGRLPARDGLELVRADLGVAIVPASLAAQFPDLRSVTIARHAPTWTLGVVHRRDKLTPAAAALFEHIEREGAASGLSGGHVA